jgi:hypothetical protein
MTFVELMICQDCLIYVANGELPDERPDLEWEIQATLDRPSRDVCPGDSENDGTFSSEPCECCGSTLGGSRHQAFLRCEREG